MFTKACLAVSLLLSGVHAGPGLRPRGYKRDCDKADRYDMPVSWHDNGFMSNMTVGTPATDIPVLVDWTWISQLVISPKCFGEFDPEACHFPGQPSWDPRGSNTFKNMTDVYADQTWKPNHFFFEDPLHVQYGSDSVGIGPVSTQSVIQLTDLTFNVSTYGFPFPFAGVFGLSPVFKGDDLDFQSAFYQQVKQGRWKNGLTGFVHCYKDELKSVCDGNDGIQSFGGIRRDLIKGNKIWWYKVQTFHDVNKFNFIYDPAIYNYWGVTLGGLKFGDEEQKFAGTSNESGPGVIMDHAAYGRGIALSENSYDRLVEITKGVPVELEKPVNNGEQAFYAVDCDEIPNFPPVTYAFEGHDKEWSVKAEDYVVKTEDGTCVINARVHGKEDQFLGNFGETFLKDKYVIFDFEKNRVGLADIEWPCN
jgi:hypothetical protein